jgi:hypothetical protein
MSETDMPAAEPDAEEIAQRVREHLRKLLALTREQRRPYRRKAS